jgi:hypothetical protein
MRAWKLLLKTQGVRNGYHLVLGQKTSIFALQFAESDVNFQPSRPNVHQPWGTDEYWSGAP